jgi:hypothetical protein
MIYPYPTLDFCLQNYNLQWQDVIWGVDKGIFTWKDVRNFALHKMSDPQSNTFDIDNNIVNFGKNEASEIMDLARDAARCTDPVDVDYEAGLWLFLSLKWVFENQSLFAYPLGAVEEIYGEFGCPESIESFVAFLPPNDGWEPTKHTAIENENRLLKNWKIHLHNSPFMKQTL